MGVLRRIRQVTERSPRGAVDVSSIGWTRKTMTNRSFAQDLVVEARGPAVTLPRRKHRRLRTIVILPLLGGATYGAYANIHHEATAAGAPAPSASPTPVLGVKTTQAKIQNV